MVDQSRLSRVFCVSRRSLFAGLGLVVAVGFYGTGALAQAPIKVGILYNTPIADVGWNFQHHSGILAMEKAFPGKVKVEFIENVSEGPDAERVIRQLAQNGNQIIFTPSFGYMEPTLKVAKEFPNVVFANGTGY